MQLPYQVRHRRLITVQAHDFEFKHLTGVVIKGDVEIRALELRYKKVTYL
jgi:hypothetical protein